MSNKEQIALDSKAVEVLKEAVGGGGSQGGASPYVLSFYDMLDATNDKHLDVERLIELGTAKVANFSEIELSIGGIVNIDLVSTKLNIQPYISPILRVSADSDNNIEIYMNGDYLVTENTTSNLVEALTLNKALIEETALTLLNDNGQDKYIGVVGIFTDTNAYPYTVEEFKSLFK